MNRGAVRPLRIDRLLGWLERHAIRDDGRVMAWRNPAHEGAPYPEAAAMVLQLLTLESGSPARRRLLAAALGADVSPRGGLGKEGRDYTFDAAAALGALDAHASAGVEVDPRPRHRLRRFVERRLERCEALADPDPATDLRWSQRFGGHLIKACARLAAGGGAGAGLALRRAAQLASAFDGRRFTNCPAPDRTYMHANLYALEGLLLLDVEHEILRAGVEWLAVVQRADGGLPAWFGPAEPDGPERSEATAQAIRLWCCVDPTRFRDSIERGLEFLGARVSPEGGIYYESGSSDVNAWATVFAAQAVRWARDGGTPRSLI